VVAVARQPGALADGLQQVAGVVLAEGLLGEPASSSSCSPTVWQNHQRHGDVTSCMANGTLSRSEAQQQATQQQVQHMQMRENSLLQMAALCRPSCSLQHHMQPTDWCMEAPHGM
jgi:hypothetical protein